MGLDNKVNGKGFEKEMNEDEVNWTLRGNWILLVICMFCGSILYYSHIPQMEVHTVESVWTTTRPVDQEN